MEYDEKEGRWSMIGRKKNGCDGKKVTHDGIRGRWM